MKKISVLLAAAIFLSTAVPGFSQPSQAQKDECLLASKNCMNQADDIQTRIHKLTREIKKGKRVYSPQELKKLQQKLQETQDMLDTLERGGGQ